MRRILPLCLLFFAPCAFADGQTHGVQFAGAPLAQCRGFVLLETSMFQVPFAGKLSHAYPSSDDLYLSWEAGAMVNTSARTAWGGTFYFADDIGSLRVGVVPRYRRWLSHSLAAELSGGPFLFDTEQPKGPILCGFMSRGALQVSDMVSLSTQLDMVRRDSAWEGRAMLGVRVGSYVAIPMTLGNLVIAAEETQPVFHPELAW